MITQKTLASILRRRKRITDLQTELDLLESKLEENLKAGTAVQSGILTARIDKWTKRNVSWKAIVVRDSGQEYADRILAATKPDSYSKLVIESI